MNQRIRVLQELGEQFERAVETAASAQAQPAAQTKRSFLRTRSSVAAEPIPEAPSPGHIGRRPARVARSGLGMLAVAASILVVVAVVAVALSSGGGRGLQRDQTRASTARSHPGHSSNSATARPATTARRTIVGGGSPYCVNSITHKRTPCSPRTSSPAIGDEFPSPFRARPGYPIKLVAQLYVPAPSGAKRPTAIARVLEQGDRFGVAIFGVGLPANTNRNAYAVWLTNGPQQSKLLGFVNPRVNKNGQLKTAGPLPKHAFRYHQLLITLETQAQPTTPGATVLEGLLHR